MEEPEFNQAYQDLIATFDPALVEKARKLKVHYWNFQSSQELSDGIDRFLAANPDEAKLLEEEGDTPNE